MKEHVLDIWADLRDRRLWPVAALLLVALVAVPVVLVKPAEETPSQASTPTPASSPGDPLAKQSVVKAFEAKPLVAISRLDQFTAKDPFKPIEQLKPLSGSDVVAVTSNGAGASDGTSGGGATAPTSSGGGTTPSAGGTTPDTGGGGGGTKPAPAKKFTYVVDLSFRNGKDTQRFHSFNRLGMLPSETSPLLVYLGVDGTGSQAAFLVDSTLSATGEGQCRPSATSCGVVYLQPGEKETFNDAQGGTYVMVLDQIRKVEVKAKASHAKTDKSDKSDKAKTADQQPRRFVFPALIDLEVGGRS
jgi:hypothetical protein